MRVTGKRRNKKQTDLMTFVKSSSFAGLFISDENIRESDQKR